MKISDAINRLIALQGLCGDLDIFGYGHNDQSMDPLNDIDAHQDNKNEWYIELDYDARY